MQNNHINKYDYLPFITNKKINNKLLQKQNLNVVDHYIFLGIWYIVKLSDLNMICETLK